MDKEGFTISVIVASVLLISFGIYLMGSNAAPMLGSYALIVGSTFLYVFTILYVVFLA